MVASMLVLSDVGIVYCQIADNSCKNNTSYHSGEKTGNKSGGLFWGLFLFFSGKSYNKRGLADSSILKVFSNLNYSMIMKIEGLQNYSKPVPFQELILIYLICLQ